MNTIGKIRRLQQCSTPDGKLGVMALDHRNNLRNALHPGAPEVTTYREIAEFKAEVVAALAPVSTAVLLDPEFGAAQCVAAGAIPGTTGLLVAVESTGYTGKPAARQSKILPSWGVEKIARMGGTAVKLLIYYHPDAPNASQQEALVRQVGEACQKFDLPYFLEPLSFSLDPAVKKLTSPEKRQVVVETARRLTPMGVDILKAEFPLNMADEQDEAVWAEACAELSAASLTPWVLLSAGVNFDQFMRQTKIACQQGCSGILGGRAVWKEAVALKGVERALFLRETAVSRMKQLIDVVVEYGRSWQDFYPLQADSIKADWYKTY
ncbi:Tagatose 1,6-bisphosphate aldolase [hydrothermal vent metagenome]|uniref:Tagatose 1,6-bisphosphate aldolase n=1 Tax=hydrothermal vent metagenome TaxID=652676 RepID=A0A3B0VQX7_9ZZZZ